jgi:hypothetical protein
MATHDFRPDRSYRTIGPNEPVLRIADGDSVITTMVDAGGRDHTNSPVTGGNPMTGPFFIEGELVFDTSTRSRKHETYFATAGHGGRRMGR